MAEDIGGALDNLVNQFSDPLSFFRELIQNAIDAGSEEVEIRFEYAEGAGDEARMMTIFVDDFGEGMDREIIDTRLTRLFSSAKDGDQTKIGKFGIGFVSVFAIEPDAVCLDTSRGGETWRVLFDGERKFTRIALTEPLDGTKIRIFKNVVPTEYQRIRMRAREVAEYWCKHARAEVTFDGETVSRPFGLQRVPCQVTVARGESRVVAGYPVDRRSFFGFYNQGLTLLEGSTGETFGELDAEHTRGEGVAYKVESPHLEHTLTRDAVIRDEGFDRAMAVVDEATRALLGARAFEMLHEHLTSGGHPELRDYLYYAAGLGSAHVSHHVESRILAHDIAGEPVRWGESWEGLAFATRPSPLAKALHGHDRTRVLLIQSGPAERGFVEDLLRARPIGARHLGVRPLNQVPDAWTALSAALDAGLAAVRARIDDIVLGEIDDGGSGTARDRIAVVQRILGEATPHHESTTVPRGLFGSRRTLVVNASHPLVTRVMPMAEREPHLAGYILARQILATDVDLDAADDARICAAALGVG